MISKINILFEDNDLVVIDKPSGMVVNRSKTTPSGTLQDILLKDFNFEDLIAPYKVNAPQKSFAEYYSSDEDREENMETDNETDEDDLLYNNRKILTKEEEFADRVGVVHRLDKGTSGIILVAKNPKTFVDIQSMFKQRKVHKEYYAAVHGKVTEEFFEVDAPIARDKKNRLRFAISSEGRKAYTKFELQNTKKYQNFSLSLLKCLPLTGRTHQIRVHLYALNHPIVGDRTYSGKRQYKLSEDLGITRLMLHASLLTLHYKNKKLVLSSSIPQEFKTLFGL